MLASSHQPDKRVVCSRTYALQKKFSLCRSRALCHIPACEFALMRSLGLHGKHAVCYFIFVQRFVVSLTKDLQTLTLSGDGLFSAKSGITCSHRHTARTFITELTPVSAHVSTRTVADLL